MCLFGTLSKSKPEQEPSSGQLNTNYEFVGLNALEKQEIQKAQKPQAS